jgi:hypothetical protein
MSNKNQQMAQHKHTHKFPKPSLPPQPKKINKEDGIFVLKIGKAMIDINDRINTSFF